jgi:hypothetical protein
LHFCPGQPGSWSSYLCLLHSWDHRYLLLQLVCLFRWGLDNCLSGLALYLDPLHFHLSSSWDYSGSHLHGPLVMFSQMGRLDFSSASGNGTFYIQMPPLHFHLMTKWGFHGFPFISLLLSGAIHVDFLLLAKLHILWSAIHLMS